MGNEPTISVIVPVYNVKPYLGKCLDSIIRQTYGDLEIIVVDDGSTDGSGTVCDEYAEQDSRIHVIHKPNGGLSSARNAGLDVATGAYVGFVDSDDYIEPFMYEKMLKAALNNDCPIVVCGINYVFDDGTVIAKAGIEPSRVFDFPHALIEMNTYRLFDMGAWSKLYRRSLFDEIRFPVGKLSEDFFIMPELFDKAQKIAFVTDACYNYYQRANSITKNKKINHDFEEAAKNQLEYLGKHHPELIILGHVSYASAALTVYDHYLKNEVPCPRDVVKHFKHIVKDNMPYIRQADYVSTAKKMQFHIFAINRRIYNVVFKLYRMKNRI